MKTPKDYSHKTHWKVIAENAPTCNRNPTLLNPIEYALEKELVTCRTCLHILKIEEEREERKRMRARNV